MPTSLRALAALILRRDGTAAVEFALIAPVLVVLVMGLVDYGALIYQNMQVAAAAHAGAQYAIHNGWSSSGITAAVTGATGLTVTATPAPQLSNACIVSGVVVTTAGTTCASGGHPGSYVLISAQSAFTPILSWPSFVMPATLSSQAMVRIN